MHIVISVLTVNCKALSLLTKCVASALAQLGEVLVVNNASRVSSLRVSARQYAIDARFQLFFNTAY